jgi:hypothetical protein
MKLYSDYASASISMVDDQKLIDVLKTVPHTHIFETGTHKGTGSTRMLCTLDFEWLVTIEVNEDNFKEASKNLLGIKGLDLIHGLSLKADEAIAFVESDEAISKHYQYPSVFIDDTENPVDFYKKELLKPVQESDLIRKILPEMANKTPLILLDSAGGVGFLEFMVVMQIMDSNPFTIILDDTHHLKHFRSRKQIFENSNFTVLYEGDGCLVASYTPQKTIRLICGRYGDIYQVASNMPQTDTIACSKKFSRIVKELFPQIPLIELDVSEVGLAEAHAILSHSYPNHRIVVCQQNGQSEELTVNFRSYQAFQEYYASI